MEERVRLAFTIGYIGRYFHGSQIQPDVKTVQGELIRVFRKLKWLDSKETSHNLVLSSRTDAGVNVRRNGGTVKLLPKDNEGFLVLQEILLLELAPD